MTGKDYFNWFSEEEKSKWIENYLKDEDSDFDYYMETEFDAYHVFFFLAFDLKRSNEGESYWVDLFLKYKKYDNLEVKKGFNSFNIQPKII